MVLPLALALLLRSLAGWLPSRTAAAQFHQRVGACVAK
jgi:hypothetical protein